MCPKHGSKLVVIQSAKTWTTPSRTKCQCCHCIQVDDIIRKDCRVESRSRPCRTTATNTIWRRRQRLASRRQRRYLRAKLARLFLIPLFRLLFIDYAAVVCGRSTLITKSYRSSDLRERRRSIKDFYYLVSLKSIATRLVAYLSEIYLRFIMTSRKNAEDPFSFLTSPLPPTTTSRERESIFQPMKPSESIMFSNKVTSKAPHRREDSAGSDFGAFVSGTGVASHPLSGSTPSSPSAPRQSSDMNRSNATMGSSSMDGMAVSPFAGVFSSSARERAEQNQQRVLNEHNVDVDDPLGWLGNPTSSTASSNTETPRESDFNPKDEGLSRVDEESLVEALAEQSLIDLSTPPVSTSTAPPILSNLKPPTAQHEPEVPFLPITTAPLPIPTPHLPRTSSDNSLHLGHDRSQSRSPPRPNMHRSPTSTSTLSRGWMSSLLSTSRASPARTSSPSAAGLAVPLSRSPSIESGSESSRSGSRSAGGHEGGSEHGAPMSPTEESLHSLFARAQHASTLPLPSLTSLPSLANLHSPFSTIRSRVGTAAHTRSATEPASSTTSPFAPHTYTPPSGAPGFAGDHNWNSGGFEYDTIVEKKNVKLVGRKEGTEAVLDTKLAGLVSQTHFIFYSII